VTLLPSQQRPPYGGFGGGPLDSAKGEARSTGVWSDPGGERLDARAGDHILAATTVAMAVSASAAMDGLSGQVDGLDEPATSFFCFFVFL